MFYYQHERLGSGLSVPSTGGRAGGGRGAGGVLI